MKKLSRLIAESGEHYVSESDHPTPRMSDASLAWHDAALLESKRLVECATIKRMDDAFLDPDGSEQAFAYAHELLIIAEALKLLPGMNPEVAAPIRVACINRIIKISELARPLLALLPTPT